MWTNGRKQWLLKRLKPEIQCIPSSQLESSFLQTLNVTLQKAQRHSLRRERLQASFPCPASTGEIAVALPQPENSHPYHVTTQNVIRSSPTLAALSEAFATVSRSSLSLRDDVTVIDRSPFVRPKDQTSHELLRVSRDASFDAIIEKKQDVGG
jgi:hypothetical protein